MFSGRRILWWFLVVRCGVVKGLGCRGAWKVGDGLVEVLAEEKWGGIQKNFDTKSATF